MPPLRNISLASFLLVQGQPFVTTSCALAGLMKLRVCSTQQSDEIKYSEYFYLDAHELSIIGNPPESRDECVAIYINNYGRLFIYGKIDEIAAARLRAVLAFRRCLDGEAAMAPAPIPRTKPAPAPPISPEPGTEHLGNP